MPDLTGCWPVLLRFLIILAIILGVMLILGGVVAIIGALGSAGTAAAGAAGGAGGAGGAGAAGSGAGAGSGSGAGGGGDAPPPAEAPPDSKPRKESKGNIQIISVKVAYLAREGYTSKVPVVLVTWKNVGQDNVSELFSNVQGFDVQGHSIGLLKGTRIFAGKQAVPPGGQHTDDERTEGVIMPVDTPPGQVVPVLDHATVNPTEYRTGN